MQRIRFSFFGIVSKLIQALHALVRNDFFRRDIVYVRKTIEILFHVIQYRMRFSFVDIVSELTQSSSIPVTTLLTIPCYVFPVPGTAQHFSTWQWGNRETIDSFNHIVVHTRCRRTYWYVGCGQHVLRKHVHAFQHLAMVSG